MRAQRRRAAHRRAAQRLVAALVVLTVLAGGALSLLGGSAGQAVAEDDGSSSAMTAAGTGPYADLRITLSRTRDLINQAVVLTWSGGRPTTPTGGFGTHFLQVMQCWADPGEQPDREQCQFGGNPGDARASGSWLSTRQVSYGSTLVDPAESYLSPGPNLQAYVPFRSVTGDVVGTGSLTNEFFDASTTNEVAFARTRADGTGQEVLEVQTLREAPGLGCGEPGAGADGVVRGRSCFLVVVPRGGVEVDGTPRTGGLSTTTRLQSSPLSQSNWQHRIVLPLEFQPVGQVCPLGAAERRTVGQELVAEAVTRWQPVLCADGGAVYGFSQVPDSAGRDQLLGADPGLVFLSRPLGVEQVPAGGPVAYAPVALSGLTVAFNIDSRSANAAPAEVTARDGIRLTELRLTPRLVAKLLTQSYRLASPAGRNPDTADNPDNVTQDPDFLALNPAFAPLRYPSGLAELIVPAGQTEATRRVWAWLLSDPDAKAFLAGADDGFGMTVNPAYRGLELPREDYPKADPFCTELEVGQPPLCTLDQAPYAADLFDAARSASRGDGLSRTSFDPLAVPPGFKKNPAQPSGQRQLLALVDTATAARFGLPTAAVRNAAGQFVEPTQAGLLAGLASSRAGASTQVLEPVPSSTDPAAYPLTSLTYAATVPAALEPSAARDFAALLRYAAGDGQVPGVAPGQLPEGYVPLPTATREQTLAVADQLTAAAAPGGTPSATTVPASPPARSPAGPATPAGIAVAPPVAAAPLAPAPLPALVSPLETSGAGLPAAAPAAVAAPEPAAADPAQVPAGETPAAPRPPSPQLAAGLTPAAPVGGLRYGLPLALTLGGAAAGGSALLRRVTGRTGA